MSDSKILLAVNGTLMRGLKLNPNMLAVNAEFVREDKTASCYRCWSINDDHPGMIRSPDNGAKIALEIWAVPPAGLGNIL
ncbi:allophanate hydrolase-related protein, partial [Klebsiella pneumoniae]|uniref:allophanate hydrolase-related protein n=2 Tax=Klebsiella/Raoultella group TaxID=2890311 RepID=UPI00404B405F